jgi:hypothetical protein
MLLEALNPETAHPFCPPTFARQIAGFSCKLGAKWLILMVRPG